MTIIDKMKDLLKALVENMHKRRKAVLALSCMVVFVTTYLLILPAFTLDKIKAAEQGGIDVPGVTETSADVTEEVADDAETAEESNAEDGQTEDAESDVSESGKDADTAKTDVDDPLTYEGDSYKIAVTDKDSVLPENTEIKVEEIDKNMDAENYEKHFNDALAAVKEEKDGENVSDFEFARFYDISLVSDGKEINPSNGDTVNVSIQYDEQLRKALGVENKDNIKIIHFAENKYTGKVEAEVLDNKDAKVEVNTDKKDQLKEASFEAESFSVYAVVYTVDFEYEDEATHEVFTYSMEGDSSITLKKLAVILGITTKEEVDDFIANVDDVKFSDEKLVTVEKTDNGWILKSLKAFDTTEKLTITMKDGSVYEVKVTDENSYSSDLGDFLSGVTINADTEGGVYVIKPGKTYTAHFSFKEDPDGKQFAENGHLEYTLPNGFSPEATSGTFTIVAKSHGVDYPVEGNRYRVENGKLIVDLNTSDPNFSYVASSPIATMDLNIEGEFNSNVTKIDWSSTISTDIKFDEDKGVSIEKSISSFNKDTGVITYQLKIKSLNGTNTNIVVTDHMDGTAVIVNQDVVLSGASMGEAGVTYTRLDYDDKTVNGFNFTIPSMAAGQEATVTYTARIDKDKLLKNGVNLDYDGKNGVNAKPDEPGKPDNDSANIKNIITAPILSKGAVVSDVVDGKRTITWTLVATSNDYFPLAGGTIKDAIQAASRDKMKYSGQGLTIVVTDDNGASTTRTVPWSQVGVNNTNTDSSWTYNVPQSDTGNKKYTITYTTVVDVSDFVAVEKLKNDVETKYKKTEGTAEVGPEGENRKANVDKKVGSVTVDNISWTVDVTVPTQGLTKAVVTDDLPRQSGGTYMDTLHGSTDDITIEGLDTNLERAVKTYNEASGQVVITFQKLVNGVWVDGLLGGEQPRTITVSFTTDNDLDWIAAAESQSYLKEHTNKVSFLANQTVLTDEATGTPMNSNFDKVYEKSSETEINGVKLPVYYYTIKVSGVSGPFDITDSFDPRLVPAKKEVYSEQGIVYGGNQYYQGEPGASPATIDGSEDGKMIIHVTEDSLAKQQGGAYHSHYRILYALRVKDAAALESIKKEAASKEGGKLTLTNEAKSVLGEDTADVTFDNNVVTKEMVNRGELGKSTNVGKFKITINPEGYDLDPESDIITVTDTFSDTLSIDYKTIKVEPAEGAMWYVSGNTATFKLPDETPLVITYDAKVIGNGKIHFWNEVDVHGQKQKYEDEEHVTSDMGGTAGNYNILILKHKRNNFTEVLSDVKFGLYDFDTNEPIKDKDGQPVTVKTNKDGIAYVEGSQADDGWSLHADKYYYLQEIEAPEGYRLSTTKYKFKIAKDNVPDYNNNIYFNGDTLHINNTPLGGLEIQKSVYGLELDESQKRQIVFTVQKPDGTTVSKNLSEFKNGKWKLTDLPVGQYIVTETCPDIDGYERTTSYSVNGGSTESGQTATVNITDPSAETTLSYINRYKSTVDIEPGKLQLNVKKKWFVGEDDRSSDQQFENKTATINLKRYRAEQPTTILKFYRVVNGSKQEITDPITVPSGAKVTFKPNHSNNIGIRPMAEGASGMYDGTGYAEAKYINPGDTATFDFSNQSNIRTIEIWFSDDPKNISVSYEGGITASDDRFTEDATYSPEPIVITGGGNKTAYNLPLTEEKDGHTYVYKYYVEETPLSGFTTHYQVGNGAFTDSIAVADAIGSDGDGKIVVKNTKESTELNLVKVDKENRTKKLENAKFRVRKIVETNASTIEEDTSFTPVEVSTDANGSAVIEDLSTGVYEISEIEMPDGYVLTNFSGKAYVKVDSSGTTLLKCETGKAPNQWSALGNDDTDKEYLSLEASTLTVSNDLGVELPHTGGIGTTIFYILGSILVIGGGIYFIARRRATK